eukprot:TRINITY_DN7759_c0_g1_i6.p1 TRINITY_DN7759_c0_g1~~TRINITY_DN7759_c0_g1_i6.p1  ORF type:complete len:1558 (-),score=220.96 TRINITY_DN7759_c0_g1_i6:91-4764(-)
MEISASRDGNGEEKVIGCTLSYLPRSVIKRFLMSPFEKVPSAQSFNGVLLLLDVSGFTKLSELCGQQGPEGLEAISTCLNSFFSTLICIVDYFRGDVVKIAGDALLIVWRTEIEDEFDVNAEATPFDGMSENESIQDISTDGIASTLGVAVRCALTSMEACKNYDIQSSHPLLKSILANTNPPFSFNIHCSISSGLLFDVICGGLSNQWEYLVCGDAVFQSLAECLGESKYGELIMDKVSMGFLRSNQTVVKTLHCDKILRRGTEYYRISWAPTRPSIRPLMCMPTATRKFIRMCQDLEKNSNRREILERFGLFLPSLVLNRLQRSQFTFQSELRHCSILFISLSGINFSKETSLPALQNAFQSIQESTQKFDGFLRQFLVDDKGCVAIVVFGAPGFGHIDDPQRAVSMALELQLSFKALGLDNSIGCSYGKVFCGDVGLSLRREFALVGDFVNIAAHLMSNKKGLLCHSSIYDMTTKYFDYEKVYGVKIKGRSDENVAFRPKLTVKLKDIPSIAQSHMETTDAHLKMKSHTYEAELGDSSKLDHVIGLLQRYQQSQSLSVLSSVSVKDMNAKAMKKVVLLSGEQGLGQSSFISRTLTVSKSLKAVSATCNCSHITNSKLLIAWGIILQQLLGMNNLDQAKKLELLNSILMDNYASTMISTSLQAPQAYNLEQIALIASLFDINLKSTEVSKGIDPTSRIQIQKGLLRRIMQSSAIPSNKVIIFQDADKMDTMSWQLLFELLHTVSMFILVTYDKQNIRSIQNYVSKLQEMTNYVEYVELKPLNVDETTKLISSQLHCELVPPEIAQSVHKKSAGNPFVIKELCRAMVDRKIIEVRGESLLVLKDLESDSLVTGNIEALVCQRLDKMDRKAVEYLKYASVIGDKFEIDTLEKVPGLESTKHGIQRHIDHCIAERILEPVEGEAGSYAFTNVMFRKAIYSTIVATTCKKYHADIARKIEEIPTLNMQDKCPTIADHYMKSENFTKAVDYYAAAGEYSFSVLAFENAIKFFTIAMENIERTDSIVKTFQLIKYNYHIGESSFLLGRREESNKYFLECVRLQDIPGVQPGSSSSNAPSTGFRLKDMIAMSKVKVARIFSRKSKVAPLPTPIIPTIVEESPPTQSDGSPVVLSSLLLTPGKAKVATTPLSMQTALIKSIQDQMDDQYRCIACALDRLADNSLSKLKFVEARDFACNARDFAAEKKIRATHLKVIGFLAVLSGISGDDTYKIFEIQLEEDIRAVQGEIRPKPFADCAAGLSRFVLGDILRGELDLATSRCDAGIIYAHRGEAYHEKFRLLGLSLLINILKGRVANTLSLKEDRRSLLEFFPDLKTREWSMILEVLVYLRFRIGSKVELITRFFDILTENTPHHSDNFYPLRTMSVVLFSTLIGHSHLALQGLQAVNEAKHPSPLVWATKFFILSNLVKCGIASTEPGRGWLQACSQAGLSERDLEYLKSRNAMFDFLGASSQPISKEVITTAVNSLCDTFLGDLKRALLLSPAIPRAVACGLLMVGKLPQAEKQLISCYTQATSLNGYIDMSLVSYTLKEHSLQYTEKIKAK